MKFLKRVIDRFLTHVINFSIELRDVITKPVYTTLYDVMLKKWGETKPCPWCDGMGILTKDGKSLQEED